MDCASDAPPQADPEAPAQQKTSAADRNVQDLQKIKREGNVAFLAGDMTLAIFLYTAALDICPEDAEVVEVLSNRGAAYLRVRAYEKAKKDMGSVMKLEETPSLKTLHRLSKALCSLHEYDDILTCLEALQTSGKWNENKSEQEQRQLQNLIETARRLKCENQSANYNMAELVQKLQQTYDCADYTGPVEVQEIPNKGLGVVASEDVEAGQVLIACKAFAIVLPDSRTPLFSTFPGIPSEEKEKGLFSPDDNRHADASHVGMHNHSKIISMIKDILTANPSAGREFYKLYAGEKLGRLENFNEETDIPLDDERITQICYYNAFFSATNPSPNPKHIPTPEVIDEIRNVNTYGLWILPSYLNHACAGVNCDVQKYGDFIIIRSLKEIKKGEELLTNYIFPSKPYAERKSDLKSYGFTCTCILCELEESESEEVHKEREELMESFLNTVLEYSMSPSSNSCIKSLEEIQGKLIAMRPNDPDINFSLLWINRQLSVYYTYLGNFGKAIPCLETAYRLTKFTSFVREGIRFALQLCLCADKSNDEAKLKEWVDILKKDILIIYGTMGVLPILGLHDEMEPNEIAKICYRCCRA